MLYIPDLCGYLLVANFAISSFEAQMRDSLVLDDGISPSQIAVILDVGDFAFLVIFTLELVLNFYAHWM